MIFPILSTVEKSYAVNALPLTEPGDRPVGPVGVPRGHVHVLATQDVDPFPLVLLSGHDVQLFPSLNVFAGH